MANPIFPNLHHLLVLRHQPQQSAAGAGDPDPNPISPPPTPTPTTTIAFSVLKAKAKAPRKKPDPNPMAAAAAAEGMGIPPCTECGKRFGSWKALFGHMRCHPERQWRGINPPPHFRRPGPVPGPGPGCFSSEEYEVASSLILLASGGPGGPAGWAQHHRCGVCLRGFSSGQALGGHMRCHWEWDHDPAAALPDCSGFVLDLNFPPPPPPLPLPPAGGGGGGSSVVLDLRLGV